ncbi:sigma-70 family RNA polymerase sigma factor [Niabella drilacis]|uniref:RNA polymerase sigma-70 factor, ECF subfamily n=1 Tax=Niabella drilacis (strain DSM 25811 / CCM 8410 / CCUG 62505 / LMG 26954 / E90) TaxID=1285928 RepID=A0A1G7A9L1_NIADE|nr:sigma-70 family RNA polymerase sigma factor [Niabella drilacis]SDE10725.1 RNA polymerase sigma-70 factor, ECF subfamily [Niabella drilacis]
MAQHSTGPALMAEAIAPEEWSVAVFEQLFLEMYPALHRLSLRITGQEDEAHDMVLDVFLKLWEERGSLPPVANIRGYLYSSVRNRSLNYLRKRDRSLAAALPPEEVVVPYDDSLKMVLDAETMRLLAKAIETLPPECGKVVRLGLEGYSTGEIAAQLGISAPAVSQQKSRAVKLLRKQLDVRLFLIVCFLLRIM